MSTFGLKAILLGLSLLMSLDLLHAGGKHLEIMAPLCKQSDFVGKPHLVTEHSFTVTDQEKDKLEYIRRSEYDKDGNAIRIETFDSSNRKTDSEVYAYDKDGTWLSLAEQSDGSQMTYLIFIDVKTKRIAKVEQRSKNTEFISYSDSGFEMGTITQTTAGKIVEKTTMKRNALGKEVHVIFEEPAGKKTSEFLIQWTQQGFESTSTLIMHDNNGDQFVRTFDYPEIDSVGNWLTQIKKTVVILKNGERRILPTVINKRTITYHQ